MTIRTMDRNRTQASRVAIAIMRRARDELPADFRVGTLFYRSPQLDGFECQLEITHEGCTVRRTFPLDITGPELG